MASIDYLGKVLNEKYRIIRRLGEGGVGAVYLGEHVIIGKKVAVKVLHAEFARDDRIVMRFFREAQAAAAIGHKNIVDVMDVGVSSPGGEPYLVMEYLEGESLGSLLGREKRLDLAAASSILEPALRALVAAHAKGIVHRDLKPDNIFLLHEPDELPTVKLIDFSIAKFMRDGAQSKITYPSQVFGTPAYMSPEQAVGASSVDHRTDLFSIGVIFYEMLSGELPFVAENNTALLLKIVSEAPRPPKEVYAGFPLVAEPVVARALAKKVEDRFQNAAEMLDSIKSLTTASERQQKLSLISTGLKRTVAEGDLGEKRKADIDVDVASGVLAQMARDSTPHIWTWPATLPGPRLRWYLGLGSALLALCIAGSLLWRLRGRASHTDSSFISSSSDPISRARTPNPLRPALDSRKVADTAASMSYLSVFGEPSVIDRPGSPVADSVSYVRATPPVSSDLGSMSVKSAQPRAKIRIDHFKKREKPYRATPRRREPSKIGLKEVLRNPYQNSPDTVPSKRESTAPTEADKSARQNDMPSTVTDTNQTSEKIGFATLQINSRPRSKVFVDKRFIGNTPQLGILLTSGKHSIVVFSPILHTSKTISISVRPGETVTRLIDFSEPIRNPYEPQQTEKLILDPYD
jgi:serine/threonine protein kinase